MDKRRMPAFRVTCMNDILVHKRENSKQPSPVRISSQTELDESFTHMS